MTTQDTILHLVDLLLQEKDKNTKLQLLLQQSSLTKEETSSKD